MMKTIFAAALAAGVAIALPAPASAQKPPVTAPQPKGSSKVGQSKVHLNQKPRSEVKKMLSRDIKRTQTKLKTVENRLDDFTATLEASPGLRRESGAWQQVYAAINEHRSLKKDLSNQTNITFSAYAAQRGIAMVPDAPRSAPPPLPQTLLPPPAKLSLKQAKAKLPPRK